MEKNHASSVGNTDYNFYEKFVTPSYREDSNQIEPRDDGPGFTLVREEKIDAVSWLTVNALGIEKQENELKVQGKVSALADVVIQNFQDPTSLECLRTARKFGSTLPVVLPRSPDLSLNVGKLDPSIANNVKASKYPPYTNPTDGSHDDVEVVVEMGCTDTDTYDHDSIDEKSATLLPLLPHDKIISLIPQYQKLVFTQILGSRFPAGMPHQYDVIIKFVQVKLSLIGRILLAKNSGLPNTFYQSCMHLLDSWCSDVQQQTDEGVSEWIRVCTCGLLEHLFFKYAQTLEELPDLTSSLSDQTNAYSEPLALAEALEGFTLSKNDRIPLLAWTCLLTPECQKLVDDMIFPRSVDVAPVTGCPVADTADDNAIQETLDEKCPTKSVSHNLSYAELFDLVTRKLHSLPAAGNSRILNRALLNFYLDAPYVPSTGYNILYECALDDKTRRLALMILAKIVKNKRHIFARRSAYSILLHLAHHPSNSVRIEACSFLRQFLYDGSHGLNYPWKIGLGTELCSELEDGIDESTGWQTGEFSRSWVEGISALTMRSVLGTIPGEDVSQNGALDIESFLPPFIVSVAKSIVEQLKEYQTIDTATVDMDVETSEVSNIAPAGNFAQALTECYSILCNDTPSLLHHCFRVQKELTCKDALCPVPNAAVVLDERFTQLVKILEPFSDDLLTVVQTACKEPEEAVTRFLSGSLSHSLKSFCTLNEPTNGIYIFEHRFYKNVLKTVSLAREALEIENNSSLVIPILSLYPKDVSLAILGKIMLLYGEKPQTREAILCLLEMPFNSPRIIESYYETEKIAEQAMVEVRPRDVFAEDILETVLNLQPLAKEERKNQAKSLDLCVELASVLNSKGDTVLFDAKCFTKILRDLTDDLTTTLPPIFGRLLCQVTQHVTLLRDFVVSRILPRLLQRKVWADNVLWQGCRIVMAILWQDSLHAIIPLFSQIPDSHLEDLVKYLQSVHSTVKQDIANQLDSNELLKSQCSPLLIRLIRQ